MPWDLDNDLMDLRGKKVAFDEGHPLAETTGTVMDVHPYPEGHAVEGAVVQVKLDNTTHLVGTRTQDITVIDPITGASMEPDAPDAPSDEVI